MSQSCDCNDYSLLTANTGIVSVSAANSSLTGAGASTVLTANGANGTIIKSIIIKATGQVTTGMVRLFLSNSDSSAVSLYREIPIPEFPSSPCTPTPPFIYPMLEIDLIDELILDNSYKLLASTQNAETFNIIAEGLDRAYPGTIPDTCCNFKQETVTTGLGTISVANSNTDGSGTIVKIFTAPSTEGIKGSLIQSITISALQSTNKGMVRLYVSPDGVVWSLMMEIVIPQTTQSAFQPSFKVAIDEAYHLKPGYRIGASTQITQSFAITVNAETWSYGIS